MRILASAATTGLACSATPVPATRIMSRSLAPSPTAIVSAASGQGGRRSHRARPPWQRAEDRFGHGAGQPAVLFEKPVGAIFLKADPGGDRSGENVEAARHKSRPGAVPAHGGDQLDTAGSEGDPPLDDAGDNRNMSPFNKATRSRNAGSKAISPFMERAVIAATRDLMPISSASSSMHSWSIMVESMSAISIFFRRPAACCTVTSTGSDASRARSSASISRAGAFGQFEVACDACASQTVLLAPTDRAALCARLSEMARAFGLEMRVATSGMGKNGSLSGDGIIKDAILIAGPTASGKSAMALDIAERENGIIVNANSMQVYSLLDVLTARPTAADQRRVPHELYGHVHPSAAYSTGAWLRDVSRIAGGGTADRQAADLRRRHGTLFPRADRGYFADARHTGRHPRSLAPAAARGWNPGPAWHPAQARPGRRFRPPTGGRSAHRPRARGAARFRKIDPGVAGRARQPADRPATAHVSSSSSRNGRF